MNETNGIEYVTRKEAAKILGLSERTILDYGQKGKIQTASGIDKESKQPCVLFHAGDLERLKFEREQPPEKRQVEVREVPKPVLAPALPPASRPWMTLDEAERHSGLSRKLLLVLIRGGKLPALEDHVKADRWRVHREDLDALRGVRL